jgi:hypothetical protein
LLAELDPLWVVKQTRILTFSRRCQYRGAGGMETHFLARVVGQFRLGGEGGGVEADRRGVTPPTGPLA